MRTHIMTCDLCGQNGAKTKYISRSYGKDKEMIVIDNIPVITCQNCGESYMTADTMHEVQRLRHHKHDRKALRLAPVINFA